MIIKSLIIDLVCSVIIYLIVITVSKIIYPLDHSFSKDYVSFIQSYKNIPKHVLQYERIDGTMYIGHIGLLVVLPSVFLAIISSGFQVLGLTQYLKTIYLIVPLFWLIREALIQVDHSRIYFNNRIDLLELILSNLLGLIVFLLIQALLTSKTSIFMSLTELRDAVWFAILVYLGKLFWDLINRIKDKEVLRAANDNAPVIEKVYGRLKDKYSSIVNDEIKTLACDENDKETIERVIYAIMIFEDYNRPSSIRLLEYIVKILLPFKPLTMGIMQYKSNRIITNKQSIRLAVKKIYHSYILSDRVNRVEIAIRDYNVGEFYYEQVMDIYNAIKAIGH